MPIKFVKLIGMELLQLSQVQMVKDLRETVVKLRTHGYLTLGVSRLMIMGISIFLIKTIVVLEKLPPMVLFRP